jgi:hypothetical protein
MGSTLSQFCEVTYKWVLDWWPNWLDSLIQRVTTLYSSLLHPHQCPQSRLNSRCLVAASNGGPSFFSGFPNCPRPHIPASHSNSSQQLNPSGYLPHTSSKFKVMLRPMVSWPVCLGIKHLSGAYDQIFITARQLQVCWCGELSLTRGRVCPLTHIVKVRMRLTVSQSVSLGVEPHLGLMTRYLVPFDSYGLFLWGALSDERVST